MPTLTIGGHDYAPFIVELEISRNDLDADGSGRDVQTGLMHRTVVARKVKIDVKKMLRLSEETAAQLLADLSHKYYDAVFLDPETGASNTKTFYTSAVSMGVQRYVRREGKSIYDGVSFSMTER